jgi:hypothetical protein
MSRRIVLVTLVFAIACGGGKKAPAPTNKTAPVAPVDDGKRPYMHDCVDGHQCSADECVAWKKQHGRDEQMALDECMQDCNCGE